jgi:acylphosphatase
MTVRVHGYVQGVGFRFSTRAYAMTLGLRGVAENLRDGDVLVIAEGPRAACETLLEWLTGSGKGAIRRPGHVARASAEWGEVEGNFRSFTLR